MDKADLSEDVRYMISEIKLNASIIAVRQLQHDLEQSLSLYGLDLATLSTDKKLDMKAIISETILLKQLNEEIKDNNYLFNKLNE